MQLPVCMLTRGVNSEIGIKVADRIVNPVGIWLKFSVSPQISNVVSTQPSPRHHRMGAHLQHLTQRRCG